MRPSNRYETFVVLLVALTVGGVATGPVGAVPEGATAQQASPSCDYADLYDQTIESVVSVQQARGQGSGFVYETGRNNSTSYVVTNAHVVGDAATVTVGFSRGESVNGTVAGADVYSDLAVVEVTDTPAYVEPVPVSADPPEHGEEVVALGNPLGLEESITHGIVSGLNRSMPTRLNFQIPNVIQTDAPISPGNSGGPLVGCDGEVVGVNTAGIAAQGAENIGFAVSSSSVERVVPSLIETGEFRHATLGVSGAAVTPAVARANDLEETDGVIVATVNPDAPAADVLQGSDRLERVSGEFVPVGGDVIVAVEGHDVSTTEDLASVLLTETRPGDEVEVTFTHDGERSNVTTTVIERPRPRPQRGQAGS